jgi:arylsulfatase A-like enzyme
MKLSMTNNMKNLVSVVPLLLMVATTAAAESPKNIVLILADDLGWADTTLYGKTSLYETPNIQRLAARGMTFTNAYASPICSPTRASIMSGQNAARHGITSPAAHLPNVRFEPVAVENGPPHQKCTNVKSSTRLDPSLPSLGKVLQAAGYATAHFGKWHLGREPHSPLELGFAVDVILILADDLGYGELGCYGCPDTRTPVMDQLAKDAASSEHRSTIRKLSQWIPEDNAPIAPGSSGSGSPLYSEFEKRSRK